jgi:cellulose 1,4-beta-cellobiosidase
MKTWNRQRVPLLWSLCLAFATTGQGCNKEGDSGLSAPGHLVAVAADGSVSLSWRGSQEADSYTVKRSGTHRGPYIRIAEGLQLTAFTDHDVTNSRLHYYVVSASNRHGESGNSAEIMAVPFPSNDVPAAPSELVALPENDRISLSWTGVTGATSYDVRRSETSGGPYASVPGSPVSQPAMVDEPPTAGTTYYYVVTATNANGTSPESPERSATPTAPAGPPSAPLSLSTDPGDTRISLTWKPCRGATVYALKRASLPGGPYALVAKTSTTQYTDTGLVNGVLWFYIVTAMNSAGESGPSDEVQSNAVARALPPPAPLNVCLNSGSERVWMSWVGSPDAAGYRVRRGTAPGAEDTVVGEPDRPGFCDTGLSNGTVYYYVVAAFNSAGESWPAAEVSSRPAKDFPAPIGVQSYGGDQEAYLGWEAAPGATQYFIRRSRSPGGPYDLIAQTADVKFENTGLKNEITYYYVVSALNSDGESINSTEVSATPHQSPAGCAGMSPITLFLIGTSLLLRRARRRTGARRRDPVPAAA